MQKEEIKNKVIQKLTEVLDPELGIDIIRLGLFIDLELGEYHDDIDFYDYVKVIMTLTSPMCPFADTLIQDVEDKINELGIGEAQVELNFDKEWEPSEELKLEFGL